MFGIIAQKLKNIDLPSFEALESELSLIKIQSQALLVTEMTHTSDLKNPGSQIFCSVYHQKREQNSQVWWRFIFWGVIGRRNSFNCWARTGPRTQHSSTKFPLPWCIFLAPGAALSSIYLLPHPSPSWPTRWGTLSGEWASPWGWEMCWWLGGRTYGE